MKKSTAMQSNTDVAKVYDTILSIPGMNDEIEVNLRISRKNLLLLNKVIERGINGKESEDKSISVLETIPKETLQEIGEIAAQLLNKAGLSEMNEKLKSF